MSEKIEQYQGFWQQVEVYFRRRSGARIAHGLCPDCLAIMYREFNEMKSPAP